MTMKRLIYLMLFLSLSLTGCKKKKTETSGQSLRVPQVAVARPLQQDIVYTYQYPAYLEAIQTVNLVARISGFLEKMNYKPGMPVKKGELLFVIEPQPYQDQLNAAKAEMESMKARLVYAQAQYEKMKEAMPTKAVSEIDYIQSESDYHAAVANLQNARAQLNNAQTNLSYAYIRAPFDGRVSRNLVDLGNFVGGSAEPVTLASIYKDKIMYAYFNMAYPEFQNLPVINNPQLIKDTTYQLTIADATDSTRIWKGKLDYSSPSVDLQTGTVTVRASIENPKGELLSGMYVKINVPYRSVHDALLIPESSIGTSQGGRYVFLVDEDNKVVQQIVKVGILTPGNMREIITGVDPDSRYVTEALMTVRPGMTVKPVRQRKTSGHNYSSTAYTLR